MKIKNIKKWILIGTIADLYLIVVYLYNSVRPDGFTNNYDFIKSVDSLTLYYILVCLIMFLVYFSLKKDRLNLAKIFSFSFIILFLVSFFFDINFAFIFFTKFSTSIFFFSTFGGVVLGGIVIPYLGIIPVGLFSGAL